MTLVTYHKDWLINANSWKRRTDQKNADKIVRKLRRHFKVPTMYGELGARYNGIRKGTASWANYRITLPRNTIPLGMINHEIAHLVAHKRYGSVRHDKKFMRALKVVNNYVKKKNFFDNEIKWENKHKQIEHNFNVPLHVKFNL